jgi:hypothetical protein
MVARAAVAAAVAAAAMGTVWAASVEDDLAVVKRAVQEQPLRVDDKDVDARESRDLERPPASGRELRWFKVRVTEKGSKKAKVTVNLPIALVRALGDDVPINIGRHAGWRAGREQTIRLSEVLATLEAGQSLVEIDDDEATVRVWVE